MITGLKALNLKERIITFLLIMSKRNQILDLYESHLQNELQEHRRAIRDIKKKIGQIKDIKRIDKRSQPWVYSCYYFIYFFKIQFKFKYQCLKCFSDSIGNELNEHIKDEESDSEVKFWKDFI